MTTEAELKDKLRKIEALFAGAITAGERGAVQAANDRILTKLRDLEGQEAQIEIKFTLGDNWNKRLFLALCRRDGLKPYRRHGQRRITIMLRGGGVLRRQHPLARVHPTGRGAPDLP